ncbi:MAG: hypothetical protein JXR96_26805 [Deltaproteobacteria bacterium]|nr:hypothetical protein [Deltaproteobacteria bacterium]
MQTSSHQIRCPACGRVFTAPIEPQLGLPPTGGDYDWCEGQEETRCPGCGAYLRLRARTWLDGGNTELLGVEVRPPPPDPLLSANRLCFSPDGQRLALLSSGSGAWMARKSAAGWTGPIALSEHVGWMDTPGDAACWSADSAAVLCGRTGRVFDREGAELARLAWEHRTVRALDLRSSGGELEALVAWLDLGKDNAWHTGVDRVCSGGRTGRVELEAHSGVAMSGQCFFDPDAGRMLRAHPPHHGSDACQLELYRIERGADLRLERIGARKLEDFRLKRALWDADGEILVAFEYIGKDRDCSQHHPFGLLRLEGSSLESLWRCELPAEVCPPMRSYYSLYEAAPLSVTELVVVSDAVCLLAASGSGLELEARWAAPGRIWSARLHAPSRSVAVSGESFTAFVDLDRPGQPPAPVRVDRGS